MIIKLTQDKVTRIDDSDFSLIEKHSWSYHDGYATTTIYRGKINGRYSYTTLKLHRLLISPPDGMEVDHKNGDKLDNRRSNLRICTKAQNQYNQKLSKNNKSGYKGVFYFAGKWQSYITKNRIKYHLGVYSSPEEAALAYNEKAKDLYGEYCKLNIVGAQ